MQNAGFLAPSAPFGWRDLYLEALFETDRGRLCSRIMQAERALLRREHELFSDTSGTTEREAVTSALNALRALRTCLALESTAAA